MRTLQDVLYNWITIKVVADARADDKAAQSTTEMFARILSEDYNVTKLQVSSDENKYYINYLHDGEEKSTRFSSDVVEILLNQIKLEPEKYVNY